MRAVVIGGSGQIGSWLLRHLAARGHDAVGTYAHVAYDGLVRLDAADPAAADWLRGQGPDVVFYPAGFTYVDGCERDPQHARAANLEQPLRLAQVATEVGARFVYFSTDYVFDGWSGPNAEDDAPNPLQVYGRSKWEAEQALCASLGDRLLIVRTSWVFGPERQGKNFAYQLVRALAAGRELPCPSDQQSNPSYGPDVAATTLQLVEAGQSGVFHVVGPELLDRVAFARGLARGFGLDPALIVGRTTAELGQKTPRPLVGGLRTNRLDAVLPNALRPLDQAVADFRARITASDHWADPFSSVPS